MFTNRCYIFCDWDYSISVTDNFNIPDCFIVGLKLLDLIRELKSSSCDPDLKVQLDVFEEQRESDEAVTAGPHTVDLSCHLDVFYCVFSKVQDTPQEIPFLSILQHLLRIDPKVSLKQFIQTSLRTFV